MTNEIVTDNPRPTTASLADALTALAAEAARQSLSNGGPIGSMVDSETAERVASEWSTEQVLVQLACDYSTRSRQELEAVAGLGLADKHDGLVQLGFEHVARFGPWRILAATLPPRYELLPTDSGLNVMFPGGRVMPWQDAVRSRQLSIEAAPASAEG